MSNPQPVKEERAGLAPFISRLTALFLPDGGCPYYKGGGSSAEPTLLAALAIFSSVAPVGRAKPLLDWAVGLQSDDGSIGADPAHSDQGKWATSQAAFVFHHFGLGRNLKRALDFILSSKSLTLPDDPRTGQNDGLSGWSWVQGTFGWVEPTAWALLALHLAGLGGHPRAVEGRRFLLDRQIPSGGWNYGNPALNDKDLLPFWDTTGLALLALKSHPEERRVIQSLDLLEKNQERIESLCGLAWTVLGLQSYGRDTHRLKTRLFDVMSSLREDELNAAHFSAGLTALSGEKVFAA